MGEIFEAFRFRDLEGEHTLQVLRQEPGRICVFTPAKFKNRDEAQTALEILNDTVSGGKFDREYQCIEYDTRLGLGTRVTARLRTGDYSEDGATIYSIVISIEFPINEQDPCPLALRKAFELQTQLAILANV